MNRRIATIGTTLLALALALSTLPALGRAEAPMPEQARLTRHVKTLASAEFQGRRGEGGAKAAEYLVARFRELGLEPLFEGAFTQTIPGQGGAPSIGRNVGAILRGSDPKLRDEWVIVSAHFDHLGTRGPLVYPGADDNASGVAMMLEVARTFAERPDKPRRSLMFIGFDLEEVGLFGSRYFVEHAPVPLSKVALFITADMIGRSLAGVCEPDVFVLGSEHAPATRPWIAAAARGSAVRLGLLGSDLLLLNRSDYGPFRGKQVPYLFFSTGENPVYHTTDDVAETLNYPKLTAISRIIASIAREAASADRAPSWSSTPDNPFEEAVTLRDVIRTLLDHKDALRINKAQSYLMTNTLRSLDAIVGRGAITPEERLAVVRVTRIILVSLF